MIDLFEYAIPRIVNFVTGSGCVYEGDYGGGACQYGKKKISFDRCKIIGFMEDDRYDSLDAYIKSIITEAKEAA